MGSLLGPVLFILSLAAASPHGGAVEAAPAATVASVSAKADPPSEHGAFTATEKEAINEAILARHPSVTILGDPTPSYDCHGFTFGAGRSWIDNDEVEKILTDQGWVLSAANAHRVGDIAIYRDEGVIRHSGVVSAVRDGRVVRIRSKWGRAGLYEHDPGDVPAEYGRLEIRHRGTALAAARPGLALDPFEGLLVSELRAAHHSP